MSIKTLDDKISAGAIVVCMAFIAYLSWHIYSAMAAGRMVISF